MEFDKDTRIYLSLSGKPGTFGSRIYNKLFVEYKLNSIYIPRHLRDLNGIDLIFKKFRISGCSISMPFKNEIINYLDQIEGVANTTQSVNTVVFEEEKLIGYNTDVYGIKSLLSDLKIKNIVIYGSGSVVDSIVCASKELGIKDIFLAARNKSNAVNKLKRYPDINLIDIENMGEIKFDLFINATPCYINDAINNLARNSNIIFDLNVMENSLLKKLCINSKKKFLPGLLMAKYQLKEQFKIYTGKNIEIQKIDEIISSISS